MLDILESEQSKPFKIRGIFMKKDSVSKNGFRYSGTLVESTVKKIQEAINNDGSYPISMMADHPGIAANKTLSVIGRVTSAYMDGDNAILEAELANTSVGKDVQELVKGQFVKGLSIRASNAKFKSMNISGKVVKDVLEMDIKGVDLVVNPGVDGAKITDIIESDQSNSASLYISIEEAEEINKIVPQGSDEEEHKLDLQELKSKHPELVEALKEEFKQLLESESQKNELKESYDALVIEHDGMKNKLEEAENRAKTAEDNAAELTAKIQESEGKLKEIEESEAKAKRASHISEKLAGLKFADSVKSKLKEKVEVLESVEEIDKVLEAEVEYLNLIIQESVAPGNPGKGKGHTGENGSKKTKLQEDEDFINMVNGM